MERWVVMRVCDVRLGFGSDVWGVLEYMVKVRYGEVLSLALGATARVGFEFS